MDTKLKADIAESAVTTELQKDSARQNQQKARSVGIY